MDQQLAVRSGGAGSENGGMRAGPPRDVEENEDEKIYYGFGVFMGLPLADLKAMKEDFLEQQQQQQQPRAPQARPPHGGDHHAVGHAMLPPQERGMSGLMPSDDGYGRVHEQDSRLAAHHAAAANGYHRAAEDDLHRQYGDPRDQRDPRESSHYYERSNGERDGDNSSEDSAHLGAKSHSINFILH